MTARGEKRPLPGWLPYLAGAVIAASLTPVFWKEIDSDAYYIIAQGREILSAGNPAIGAPAYYGTMRGTVQNWLWCVVLALAERVPHNAGPAIVVVAQAALLELLLHGMLARHVKDGWAAMAFSLLCALPTGSIYLYGLRPEAVSVILVLLTALGLEKYRESGKGRWLVLLPVCAFAESNIHAAMWPYHFAIMAAYLVPAPGWLESDNARLDRKAAAAVSASAAALFLNPYGADAPAYVFRALPIFSRIAVEEQGPMKITLPQGVLCAALTVLFLVMAIKRQIRSSNAWTAAGLLFLAWANYHSAIFVPVASYAIAASVLDRYEELGPARIGTSAPGYAAQAIAAASVLCLAASMAVLSTALPGIYYATYSHMLPAVQAVSALQREKDGNVVSDGIAGSFMEWYGIDGIFVDTRCEMLLGSVNKERDTWQEYAWMETGATQQDTVSRYGSIQGCLDANGVEYVVLNWADSKLPFLAGYVTASPDWEKAGLDDPEHKSLYDVWVRIDGG